MAFSPVMAFPLVNLYTGKGFIVRWCWLSPEAQSGGESICNFPFAWRTEFVTLCMRKKTGNTWATRKLSGGKLIYIEISTKHLFLPLESCKMRYHLVSPYNEVGENTEIDLGIPWRASSSSEEFTVRACPRGRIMRHTFLDKWEVFRDGSWGQTPHPPPASGPHPGMPPCPKGRLTGCAIPDP